MEDFVRWFGPCLAAAMGCYWFWKNRNQETEEAESLVVPSDETINDEQMANRYDGLNTCQLLEKVLKNIGCHINMCKDEENHIYATYQGEHFTIIYSETSPYITIYDVAWYSAELIDIDNLSLVRQAVNVCNKENISTVLYTIDKEENCVNVHTRQCIVFGSYIPDVEDYLRSRFEDSFRQHHNFYRNMEEIRKEQFAY